MLTGKERSRLRSKAQTIDSIIMVGKNGVTDNLVAEIRAAFNKRELLKGTVLDTSLLDSDIVGRELADKTDSEFVQAIGSKFVLYKENRDLPDFKRAL